MATNKNVEFEPIATRCCGLDVHKVEIVATKVIKICDIREDGNHFSFSLTSRRPHVRFICKSFYGLQNYKFKSSQPQSKT